MPNIELGFVFFSLQSHHIVNTMTHHAIFIPKRLRLNFFGAFILRIELQNFSSPRRNVFVSAENVTCHRGDDFSSPRREEFLSTVNREKLWSHYNENYNNIHLREL